MFTIRLVKPQSNEHILSFPNPKSWTRFSRLIFKVGNLLESYRHMSSNHLQNDIPNSQNASTNSWNTMNNIYTLDVKFGSSGLLLSTLYVFFGEEGVEEYPILHWPPPMPLVDLWQSNRPRRSSIGSMTQLAMVEMKIGIYCHWFWS